MIQETRKAGQSAWVASGINCYCSRCWSFADFLEDGHDLFERFHFVGAVAVMAVGIGRTRPVKRIGFDDPRARGEPRNAAHVLLFDLPRVRRFVGGKPSGDTVVDPTVKLPKDRV